MVWTHLGLGRICKRCVRHIVTYLLLVLNFRCSPISMVGLKKKKVFRRQVIRPIASIDSGISKINTLAVGGQMKVEVK